MEYNKILKGRYRWGEEKMGTISVEAEASFNTLTDQLGFFTTQTTIDNLLTDLQEREGEEDYWEILRDLWRILKTEKIEFDPKRKDADYYKDLLKNYRFPSYEENLFRMLHIIIKQLNHYYSPEKYMKRIVDRFEGEDDRWKDEPLRLRILKKFIKEGNSLKDLGIGGDMAIRKEIKKQHKELLKMPAKNIDVDTLINYLDDSIFGLLNGADANQKKPKGTYGLLTIVNDLAKGLFRKEGFTKKYLYYFAMVYGMTYNPNEVSDENERNKDINCQLFEGYYENNLLQFLNDEYKKNKNGQYENYPNGQGINKKNYAELVYLYFIRQEELTAREKLIQSAEVIKQLNQSDLANFQENGDETKWYATAWKDFFALKNTEDFKEKVLKQYDCRKKERDDNPMIIKASQKTAFKNYEELVSRLKDYDIRIEDCRYGLRYLFEPEVLRKNPKAFLAFCKDVTEEELNNFLDLITRLNMLISYPEIAVTDSEKISRTSIISVYYYLFIKKNQKSRNKMNFQKIYSSFETGVNTYLEESYYQPLSIKNYFDILVVLAAYASLN